VEKARTEDRLSLKVPTAAKRLVLALEAIGFKSVKARPGELIITLNNETQVFLYPDVRRRWGSVFLDAVIGINNLKLEARLQGSGWESPPPTDALGCWQASSRLTQPKARSMKAGADGHRGAARRGVARAAGHTAPGQRLKWTGRTAGARPNPCRMRLRRAAASPIRRPGRRIGYPTGSRELPLFFAGPRESSGSLPLRYLAVRDGRQGRRQPVLLRCRPAPGCRKPAVVLHRAGRDRSGSVRRLGHHDRRGEGYRSPCVGVRHPRYHQQEPIGHSPMASQTRRAVSAPEKFCCPVTRFPSRTAKLRQRPA
jgi:hypothetical protein